MDVGLDTVRSEWTTARKSAALVPPGGRACASNQSSISHPSSFVSGPSRRPSAHPIPSRRWRRSGAVPGVGVHVMSCHVMSSAVLGIRTYKEGLADTEVPVVPYYVICTSYPRLGHLDTTTSPQPTPAIGILFHFFRFVPGRLPLRWLPCFCRWLRCLVTKQVRCRCCCWLPSSSCVACLRLSVSCWGG